MTDLPPRETYDEEASPPEQIKWSQTFGIGSYIVVALFIAAMVWLWMAEAPQAELTDRESGQRLGNLMGRIVGGFLFAAILSGLAFLLSRRRSRSASTITFGLVLILVGIGQVGQAVERRQDQQAMLASLGIEPDQRDRQTELLERVIRGEDVGDEVVQNMSDQLTRIETATEGRRDRDALAMRAVANTMRGVESPNRAYLAAYQAFDEAGGIDAATFDQPQDYPERLKLLDDFEQANERFAEAYQELEPQLREQLAANGFDAGQVKYLVSRWRSGAQPDLIARVRDTDRRAAVEFRALIEILQENHGRWRVDDDGAVAFEDDVSAETYQQHFETMQAVIDEQSQAQQEILDAVKQAP